MRHDNLTKAVNPNPNPKPNPSSLTLIPMDRGVQLDCLAVPREVELLGAHTHRVGDGQHLLRHKKKEIPGSKKKEIPVTKRKEYQVTKERNTGNKKKGIPGNKKKEIPVTKRKKYQVTKERKEPVTKRKKYTPCCATTDSTGSSMRLNSSKQPHNPPWHRPLKRYIYRFTTRKKYR